jgi:hypothetical protein
MALTLIYGDNEDDRDYDGVFRDEDNGQPCARSCRFCSTTEHCWSLEHTGDHYGEPTHPAALLGIVSWFECRHCPAWKKVADDHLGTEGDA